MKRKMQNTFFFAQRSLFNSARDVHGVRNGQVKGVPGLTFRETYRSHIHGSRIFEIIEYSDLHIAFIH